MEKRLIKFRLWDDERQEFVYADNVSGYSSSGYDYPPFTFEFWGKRQNEWGDCVDYNIQQWTELKDENGVDIYEGDIGSNEAAIWEVIFHTGCFCGKMITQPPRFTGTHIALRAIKGFKVTGHIYQKQLHGN